MMRRALIDFEATLFTPSDNTDIFTRDLSAMFDALAVHGLRVVGSAPSPIDAVGEQVRLVVEACGHAPDALPAECESGWTIVRPMFVLYQHGHQRTIKVERIEIVGKPRLSIAA